MLSKLFNGKKSSGKTVLIYMTNIYQKISRTTKSIMHFKLKTIFPYRIFSLSHSRSYIYYYYYYYCSLWEFFTSTLADGFPLEFEWQQVFSSLHDSSQYSGRSEQYWSVDSLFMSTYLQILQSLYQSFGDCTKSTHYNCYNRHFHVSQCFNSRARSRN